MSFLRFRRRRAFTLVELLVAIAIIGMLLGLLLPAVQRSRAAARRAQCQNNMRQIALALTTYETERRRLPPSHTKDPDHNVLTFILPFIEQQAVYDRFDLSVNWNKTPNTDARKANIPSFVCPETKTDARQFVSDYAPNTKIQPAVYNPLVKAGLATSRALWYNMLRPDQRPVRVADVRDGMTNSMLFFEDAGRPFGFEGSRHTGSKAITGSMWADVDAFFYTHSSCGSDQLVNCNNMNETYSFHTGGCFFAYGDCSVLFHSERINPEVFFARFTYNQGDIIPEED